MSIFRLFVAIFKSKIVTAQKKKSTFRMSVEQLQHRPSFRLIWFFVVMENLRLDQTWQKQNLHCKLKLGDRSKKLGFKAGQEPAV